MSNPMDPTRSIGHLARHAVVVTAAAVLSVVVIGCSAAPATVGSAAPSAPTIGAATQSGSTGPSGAVAASPTGTPAPSTPATPAATVVASVSIASPRDVLYAFGSIWVADGPADDVIRLDPATDAVVAKIAVPDPASVLTSGAGAVWLTSYPDRTLTRIDPATNKPTKTISLEPASAGPIGVTVLGGFVWVGNHDGSPTISVSKVDVTTLKVVDVISVGTASDSGPSKVVSAAGAIWTDIAGANSVVRIDPRTDAVVATISVPSACGGLVVDDDVLWVAGGSAGDGCMPGLNRIDPTTNAMTATVRVSGDTNSMAVAPDRRLWAVAGSELLRIERSSASISGRWTIRGSAFEETIGGGFLWVTDRDAAMLYKVELPAS
jgi:streptogramin lyase